MAVNSTIKAVRLSGRNAATLTGGYDVIDPAGLDHACFMIRIINASNVEVGISYDGVITNDFVINGETLQLPFQSNSQPSGYVALMPKGTKVYVISPVAGIGEIWLAGYYQV